MALRNRCFDGSAKCKETVHGLHNAGIIWGDVKPDNIMIDEKNNPWIVDFGGGYNSGWVDEDMMETVEGDLQGINFSN